MWIRNTRKSRDQRSEVRGQRSEIGDQRSEVGGQRSEVGSQRSAWRVEIRMQINSAKDLKVYKAAYELAMRCFELSKKFPAEENFALNWSNPPIIPVSFFELA
jgi:23S rRNA-intervening sequence protein